MEKCTECSCSCTLEIFHHQKIIFTQGHFFAASRAKFRVVAPSEGWKNAKECQTELSHRGCRLRSRRNRGCDSPFLDMTRCSFDACTPLRIFGRILEIRPRNEGGAVTSPIVRSLKIRHLAFLKRRQVSQALPAHSFRMRGTLRVFVMNLRCTRRLPGSRCDLL